MFVIFFLCFVILFDSWLLFICFVLEFLLVASESYFESPKLLVSYFCVATRLDLFNIEFWFRFVYIMHVI